MLSTCYLHVITSYFGQFLCNFHIHFRVISPTWKQRKLFRGSQGLVHTMIKALPPVGRNIYTPKNWRNPMNKEGFTKIYYHTPSKWRLWVPMKWCCFFWTSISGFKYLGSNYFGIFWVSISGGKTSCKNNAKITIRYYRILVCFSLIGTIIWIINHDNVSLSSFNSTCIAIFQVPLTTCIVLHLIISLDFNNITNI